MKDEDAMINAIRHSLMQFETDTVKNPVSSSPGAPPGYPVQSSVSIRRIMTVYERYALITCVYHIVSWKVHYF